MSITAEIKNAVAARDFTAIRDSLFALIALDPNFSDSFKCNWNYCRDMGISENDIYETHDGRPLPGDITQDNFFILCGQLRTNFSKERLEMVKKIGRLLYPIKDSATEKKNAQDIPKQDSQPIKGKGYGVYIAITAIFIIAITVIYSILKK